MLLRANQRAVIANINSGLALAPKTNSAVYCPLPMAGDELTFSTKPDPISSQGSNLTVMHTKLQLRSQIVVYLRKGAVITARFRLSSSGDSRVPVRGIEQVSIGSDILAR